MNFADARVNMVKSQLRPVRITDPGVLEAMIEAPREAFVPEDKQGVAYADDHLSIGAGRYMLSPLATAQLLQAARVREDDAVMVVGCGSGYSAALLSRMAGAVVAVEEDAGLASKAETLLTEQEASNVIVVRAALTEGHPEQAPYDVIVIDGAVTEVAPALLDQLADGGRLVAILSDGTTGRVALMNKVGGAVGRREIFDINVPTLSGFEAQPSFVF